jgi:hypothetical protein
VKFEGPVSMGYSDIGWKPFYIQDEYDWPQNQ